jgi:hypothetical protein
MGCSILGIPAVVGLVDAIISIVNGSEPFFQKILPVLSQLWTSLTEPFLLPTIIGILVVVYLLGGLLIYARQKAHKVDQARESFRDLLLISEQSPDTNLRRVVNRELEQARCAECSGRIIGFSPSANQVLYLTCENSHFAGNRMSYEDYQKYLQVMQRQAAEIEAAEKERFLSEQKKLNDDLKNGVITQDEFEQIMNSAPRITVAGYYSGKSFDDFSGTSPQIFRSPQELYAKVIEDYEDHYQKEQIKRIKPLK